MPHRPPRKCRVQKNAHSASNGLETAIGIHAGTVGQPGNITVAPQVELFPL